jgi:hypothetical protein
MITTKLQAANLALDIIGEPYLATFETLGTTGDAVRLHFDPVFEQVLEGHIWSFSTKTAILAKTVESAGTSKNLATATVSGDTVTITTSTAHGLVVGSYVTIAGIANSAGVTPNGVRLVTAVASTTSFTFALVGASGTLTPHLGQIVYAGVTYPIASMSPSGGVLAIILVNTAHGITGTNLSGAVISGTISTITAANGTVTISSISGASNQLNIATAPAGGSFNNSSVFTFVRATMVGPIVYKVPANPNWLSSYDLPASCLRVIRIIGDDRDIPVNLFEIEQRQLLLMDEFSDELPIIQFITNDVDVSMWSSTFVEAITLLLASKLCIRLTQDVQLAALLLQRHEVALGKARSKDSKETRSNENRGARQMAARSELVRSRYSRTIIPPY